LRATAFVILLFAIVSCSQKNFKSVNRFDDPVIRKIADFQDRRESDSLNLFLAKGSSAQRAFAAIALGSVQDSLSAFQLGKIVSDDTARTNRISAAFALGQIHSQNSSKILISITRKETSPEFLEAIGKTAAAFKEIKQFLPANVEDFHSGHGWMLYRFGLNHPLDSVPTELTSATFGKQQPVEQRLAVTQFLARGVKRNNKLKSALIDCVMTDPSAEVRMNAAFALRRIKADDVMQVLQSVSEKDPDYRVRVNAIRSLQAFPIEKTRDTFLRALRDSINVAITASEVIEILADERMIQEIDAQIPGIEDCRIKANLHAALEKLQPGRETLLKTMTSIVGCDSIYGKAAMIRAMQYDSTAVDFLIEFMIVKPYYVINSTATTALAYLFRHTPDTAVRAKIADSFQQAVRLADPAVVGIVSEAIADTALHFQKYYPNADFLREARAKLSLPRDIEAIQPLENAIAVLENKPFPDAPKNSFNHPIAWSLIQTIPSDQKIQIETSRGNIVIQLFVDETPGTVSNFVALAENGYFNEKFFHRVVPNFVVQAGCNRGDGWGSEDYSIRSEFTPRKFSTGSVGMASAGKDTEGTQWFITHSPTPHLDGRYTNFAQVISGMDVVHRLEVGDRIISVKRL
jgi:cyclophilin family peptidyl-prolyl cis-trans isomerase/HEAT repeat protein